MKRHNDLPKSCPIIKCQTKGLSTAVIMTLLIVAVVGSSSNFTAQNVYAGQYSTNNDQASSQAINCSGNNQNCVNINPQA